MRARYEMSLSFCAGLPEIDLAIGDRRLRLMIDSGAHAAISLAADLLTLPGVAVGGDLARFGDATGRRFEARRFTVDRVDVGRLSFADVHGIEHAFSEEFAPPNRDGFVGRSLFDGYRLLFDYADATLTVSSGAEEESSLELRSSTSLESSGEGWVFVGELDGVRTRFLVDTGSTHSLVRVPGAPSRGERSRTATVTTGDIVLESLDLIEVDLQGPPVDVILGANFFVGRSVLVDVERRRLWVG